MVLPSVLEIDWESVSSVVEKEEDGKNPLEDVRDRSLSYLDLEEQLIFRENKVFESVRKYGRPRQQINDFLIFKEFDNSFGKDKKCDRYHFGQCLVLPKVSTLPPKEKANHYDRRRNRCTAQSKHTKCCPVCFKKTQINGSINHVRKTEDKMYRWNDTLPGNYREKSFEDGNLSLKSERVSSRRDYGDFYLGEADVEAQNYRRKKHLEKNPEQKNEYYSGSRLKRGSRKSRNADEEVSPERKITDDLRDNWEVKVVKENEPKQMRSNVERERERERNSPRSVYDDEWEMPVINPSWRVIEEYVKKELHRSKSTPDMLVGNKKNLEVWKGDEKPKRNGSMGNVCARTLAVYNDQQEADSLNDPQSLQEPVSATEAFEPEKRRSSKFASGKNFFGHFLTSRVVTPMPEMFSDTEPFSQFWVKLSNIYGQALVILMVSFILTEVMDNSVNLLSLQGIFLMYLYVGSIIVIICIYIWVLIDSCSSIQNDSTGLVPPTITTTIVLDRETELQNISSSKFGSLKKAHISRDRTSNTSFYLRIGAIAFGLGTLVFNGLEMAMHSMMEGSCLNDIVFVHPILHGLFTFLQMHFLFVNSQVLVEKFGLAARFGFMHLAATNLALWIRLVIWDSGNEWTHYIYLKSDINGRGSDVSNHLYLRGFPKSIVARERNSEASGLAEYQAISNEHISQVVALHECLNSNSLGQLWTSSMPFLYPFIIQFSIIAAAVTYIMGQNVAKDHLFFQKQKKGLGPDGKGSAMAALREGFNSWGVDCSGASKGLFLGILCLVTGIVVIIIFLVVKENDDFPPDTIFWLTNGTLLTILSITLIMNIVGLIQIRKLSVIGTKMTPLDKILMALSIAGVQLYSIVSIVVGGAGAKQEDSEASSLTKRHAMLLSVSIIQIIQIVLQSCFIVEGIRRKSLTRTQILNKPARQVITYLIFSNAVLWAFDSFVIHSWMSQELQLRFFGILTWGVISRIGLPLLVFLRFHSCVLLLEIWKNSYQSLSMESGN